MIRSFGDAPTGDVFYGENTRAARRLPKELWPLIRRKLDALHAAHSLNDVRVPPGNRLEALKGGRAGQFSIRVNERYRISFRFEGGHAWEVCCEDYH